MSIKRTSFTIELAGARYIFAALTLQNVIAFAQSARLATPNPLNWVIAELDKVSDDAGRRSVMDAIKLALRQISAAKRPTTENRYLWTRDGLRLLFDFSLTNSGAETTAEDVLNLATDEQVLKIATEILEVTRVALEGPARDGQDAGT